MKKYVLFPINLVLFVVAFVVSLVVQLPLAILEGFYWNFKAGVVLGERRSLTGKEFDQGDIHKLAMEMKAEAAALAEHREKHKGV